MRITLLLIILFFLCLNAISFKTENFLDNQKILVEVKGEVMEEKIVELKNDAKFIDLLENIELTENADISSFSLTSALYHNQIIVIPPKENNFKVSINSAGVQELMKLPGIGESIANKIVEYRNEIGSFHTIEEIQNVKGIGNKKYEAIKEYLTL